MIDKIKQVKDGIPKLESLCNKHLENSVLYPQGDYFKDLQTISKLADSIELLLNDIATEASKESQYYINN